jgi:hypothetical protein
MWPLPSRSRMIEAATWKRIFEGDQELKIEDFVNGI